MTATGDASEVSLKNVWAVTNVIGIGMGALSLTVLLFQTVVSGPSRVFALMIAYYGDVMHVLFGWLEPLIRAAFAYLHDVAHLTLHVDPWWRYWLMFTWAAFSADILQKPLDALDERSAIDAFVKVLAFFAMILLPIAGSAFSTADLGIESEFWLFALKLLVLVIPMTVFDDAAEPDLGRVVILALAAALFVALNAGLKLVGL